MRVPPENIRQANAIYFHQLAVIDKLLRLDSLRKAHNQALSSEIRTLHTRDHVNQKIIHNQELQLGKHESIIASYKRQNRLLWAGLTLVTTYFVLQ